MRTRTLALLLALLAVASIVAVVAVRGTHDETARAAPVAVHARGTGVRRDGYSVVPGSAGLNAEASEITGDDLERIRAVGITHLRFGLRWASSVETVKGQYNWEHYDGIQAHMQRVGLKPIYLLAYSNKLYNTDDYPFNEEAEREGFKNFAAAAVERYDGPGVIWEIGNEQDTFHFWETREKGNSPENARVRARDYMKLVRLTVPAMRKASPKAFIISGGVLDINWGVTQAWLEEAFKLGSLELFDGLGIHMYGKPPAEPEQRMLTGMLVLRERLSAHGAAADYPIFQTEFGIGLHNDHLSGPFEARLLAQAKINVRVYLLSLMEGLKVNVWYEWRRKSKSAVDERGMVDWDGAERPMYVAAKTVLDELAGFVFDSRHPLEDARDFALLFTRGDERKLAAWTAGEPRDLALVLHGSPSQVAVTSMLGTTRKQPAPDGRLTLRLTGSPTYVRWKVSDGANAAKTTR